MIRDVAHTFRVVIVENSDKNDTVDIIFVVIRGGEATQTTQTL